MSLLAIAIVLAAASAGCKDRVDAALDEMQAYRDRACACQDLACVVSVEEEWRKRGQDLQDKAGRANGAQSRRALELAKDMLACKERRLANPTGAP